MPYFLYLFCLFSGKRRKTILCHFKLTEKQEWYKEMCLVTQSCSTLWDPVDCSPPGSSVHGDSPSKNAGVDCHALLQRIFPTQGLNLGLPHCRWILYHLSHQGSPQHSALLYHRPVLLHLKKKCVSHSGLLCPQNIRSLGEEHWIFNLCILSA